MNVEYIPVGQLKPYAKNARKHEEYDVGQIAESIERYGFNDPIGIWGKDNIIVEGHGRLLAAKKLGMDKVPCIRLDDLTDEQRREYAIMHNKTAELSSWDFDLLAEDIGELDFSGFDIDWGIVSPDDYGESFELPDGDKSEICQMTFTLHERQAELIKEAIKEVKDDITETFGNTNSNGNALYEVVKEWAEQRI